MLHNSIDTAMTAPYAFENVPQRKKCSLIKFSEKNCFITLDHTINASHISCLTKSLDICLNAFAEKNETFNFHFYILDLEKTNLHFLFQTFRLLGKYKSQGLRLNVCWSNKSEDEHILNIGKDLAEMYGVSINNFLIHK